MASALIDGSAVLAAFGAQQKNAVRYRLPNWRAFEML